MLCEFTYPAFIIQSYLILLLVSTRVLTDAQSSEHADPKHSKGGSDTDWQAMFTHVVDRLAS